MDDDADLQDAGDEAGYEPADESDEDTARSRGNGRRPAPRRRKAGAS